MHITPSPPKKSGFVFLILCAYVINQVTCNGSATGPRSAKIRCRTNTDDLGPVTGPIQNH